MKPHCFHSFDYPSGERFLACLSCGYSVRVDYPGGDRFLACVDCDCKLGTKALQSHRWGLAKFAHRTERYLIVNGDPGWCVYEYTTQCIDCGTRAYANRYLKMDGSFPIPKVVDQFTVFRFMYIHVVAPTCCTLRMRRALG